VGLNSQKSLNLTNVYPNNKNKMNKKNNKVKSKPLELRSRVKTREIKASQYFLFLTIRETRQDQSIGRANIQYSDPGEFHDFETASAPLCIMKRWS
jgi:hypothetical protein